MTDQEHTETMQKETTITFRSPCADALVIANSSTGSHHIDIDSEKGGQEIRLTITAEHDDETAAHATVRLDRENAAQLGDSLLNVVDPQRKAGDTELQEEA